MATYLCPTCKGSGRLITGPGRHIRCYDCAGVGRVTSAVKARIIREENEKRQESV